jgi:type IV pilus assembly protein PilF
MMWRLFAAVLIPASALEPALAAERTFEVSGRVEPEVQAAVSLFGATTPFSTSTLTDGRGRFRFTRIEAGQYTVAAFSPGYGEKRLTIDVGPSSADNKGRFEVTVRLDEGANVSAGASVSAADLAVPERARKEYAEAQKRLSKRDVPGAIARLERAVEIAPQFAAAWNHLGTIAYQERRFPAAEVYFRRALKADPSAYEPLVNLGGVLLTEEKVDEAYPFNLYAVLKRPSDALANSQLGMNYFGLDKQELAEKYLNEARRLDPGHFSHPQLLLAEIYLRRNDREKAAQVLEEFLRYHPDWPQASVMREGIERLRRH